MHHSQNSYRCCNATWKSFWIRQSIAFSYLCSILATMWKRRHFYCIFICEEKKKHKNVGRDLIARVGSDKILWFMRKSWTTQQESTLLWRIQFFRSHRFGGISNVTVAAFRSTSVLLNIKLFSTFWPWCNRKLHDNTAW